MAKKTEVTFGEPSKTNGLKARSNRVTFGTVTVTSAKPQPDIVARNVAAGQSALGRAAKKLSQPGIVLRTGKGVPVYFVDDTRPKEIVRELNGQRIYGVFRNGKFVASNG